MRIFLIFCFTDERRKGIPSQVGVRGKKRPETRDQITLIGVIFQIEQPATYSNAGLRKSRSNYVIWSLVSGLSI